MGHPQRPEEKLETSDSAGLVIDDARDAARGKGGSVGEKEFLDEDDGR